MKSFIFCFLLCPYFVYSQDYRQEMRNLVMEISAYAKKISPDFLIIPQNGQALATATGRSDGIPEENYLQAIDGTGREDLYYGYNRDNRATSSEDRLPLLDLCRLMEEYHVEVLVTDYCSSENKMQDSYLQNESEGFISYAADERELNRIADYPEQPWNIHFQDVHNLHEARNFLYLINSEQYDLADDFLKDLKSTNYDLVIMDLFHNDHSFTSSEITSLKQKKKGGERLVIAYMSIGEAEDYRYYWQNQWEDQPPSWLEEENSRWRGNYKVRYWDRQWKSLLFGSPQAYLDRILAAGFDGVYLDIIDGYEFFEQ